MIWYDINYRYDMIYLYMYIYNIYTHILYVCMYLCTYARMHVCMYVCALLIPVANGSAPGNARAVHGSDGSGPGQAWEVPRRFFVGKSSMTLWLINKRWLWDLQDTQGQFRKYKVRISIHKCMMYIPYVCICYVYIYIYVYVCMWFHEIFISIYETWLWLYLKKF
jgi:hypothetical protein